MAVDYGCNICNKEGWSNPFCDKCEIYRLKKRIQELENENTFLRKDQDQQFNLTPHLFNKFGLRHLETKYLIPLNQDNLYFLTITFDPSRFKNLGTDAAAEETYILHQLALATNDELLLELEGCFELQSNGNTHAHAHVRTYQPIELQQTLKKKFTNNMRNDKAIDLQPARTATKGINYINKIQEGKGCENKTWFSLKSRTYKNSLKPPEGMSEDISLPGIGSVTKLETESPIIVKDPVPWNVYVLDSPTAILQKETERRKKLGLKKPGQKISRLEQETQNRKSEIELAINKTENKTLKKILKKKLLSIT